MKTSTTATFLIAALFATSAFAQGSQKAPADEHPMGQHPAVIVKKLAEKQGYDYVSKFYPHPAWLYLLPEAPAPDDLPLNLATRGKDGHAAQGNAGSTPAKASN